MPGVVAAAVVVAEMLKLVSHQFGDRAGQGEGAQRGKDNGDQQKYHNFSSFLSIFFFLFSLSLTSMSSISSGGGDHRQL